MNQQEFFETVLRALEELSVQYMVAGSVAAMVYGEPRRTNYMDVVVELLPEAVDQLAQSFPLPDYYFPPRAAAIQQIR